MAAQTSARISDITATQVCMLDTMVFNDLVDGRLPMEALAGYRLLVIGVQKDELSRCRKERKRNELLAKYEEVDPTKVLASSFTFDIEGAGLDQAEWNDGTGAFDKMLAKLKELDRNNKNN